MKTKIVDILIPVFVLVSIIGLIMLSRTISRLRGQNDAFRSRIAETSLANHRITELEEENQHLRGAIYWEEQDETGVVRRGYHKEHFVTTLRELLERNSTTIDDVRQAFKELIN